MTFPVVFQHTATFFCTITLRRMIILIKNPAGILFTTSDVVMEAELEPLRSYFKDGEQKRP